MTTVGNYSTCQKCGSKYHIKAGDCPHCKTDSHKKESRPKDNPNIQIILASIGTALLFCGAFLPIIKIPFLGTVNYFQNGKGDGVFIVGLCIIALLLIVMAQCRGILYLGLANLSIFAFTYVRFQNMIEENQQRMSAGLAGNPFKGLAEIAAQSIHLEWGWAVLILGAVLQILSAHYRQRPA